MKFKSLCAIAALVMAPIAQAAFVTLPEAGMDAIFSQASFGNRTVDIRFGPVSTKVAPDLLAISTDAEVDQLFLLHSEADNIVNFYFVDSVDACGGINAAIIGCGEFPGNDFVVESAAAAGASGAQLLAHELAHNLGLPHVDGATLLMNPVLLGGTLLSEDEVNTILGSPLIQVEARTGQRFIQINPVLIVERLQQVPEPSTLALLMAGGVWARLRSRKQRTFV